MSARLRRLMVGMPLTALLLGLGAAAQTVSAERPTATSPLTPGTVTTTAEPQPGATSSGAGQVANLEQLLAEAEKQNFDQRITAEQRVKATAEVQQAWLALFPVLSAQAGWTHNQNEVKISLPTGPTTVKELVITPADQLDGLIRVDLPLVDTGRWMRLQAAESSKESAGAKERSVRDLVRRQAVASWYGYAAALAVRQSAKRSAEVAETQAKLMEIRRGAGVVTELDSLRARAEVQRTRQVVADTETLVATTRRGLSSLSGVQPPADVALPADDLKAEAGFDELVANVEKLPAIEAADRDAEAAAKLLESAKLAFVPLLNANFTERFSNATGFSGKNDSWTAGLGLSWRLDGPTYQQLKVSEAVVNTALLAAQKARLAAKDQLFNDGKRLEAARFKVESAEALVQVASKAAQVAKDRYAAGAATQIDVIQAERDLFGAEVGQIQARTELASTRAAVRLSAGLPLFPAP